MDFSIGTPPPDGYACWDSSRCGLCKRFLEPRTVLELFTYRYFSAGKVLDLLRWSQGGRRCTLCIYLYVRFVEEMDGEPLVSAADFVVRWDTKSEWGKIPQIGAFTFEIAWGFPNRRAKRVSLNCFAEDTESVCCFVPTRPINPEVGSPTAFAKAKSWLTSCIQDHQCSSSTSTPELPTRVLEITPKRGEGYNIRLYPIIQGENVPYVALSYVWGDPKRQYKTILDSFHAHLEDIPFQILPRTIADAVSCTYQLGLKYLWVDSLCIIQDSREDKGNEIQKMASIYKNAHVTISAAKVQDSHEGFLERRTRCDPLISTSFRVPMLVPRDESALLAWIEEHHRSQDASYLMDRAAGNMFNLNRAAEDTFSKSPWANTTPWAEPNVWFDFPSTVRLAAEPLGSEGGDLLTATEVGDEPISTRGWTLQESWLSNRLLVYGSRQLQWICHSGREVDGGRKPYELGIESDRPNMVNIMIQNDESKINTLWQTLVHGFSSRQLGDPSDKLNALEGIAQEFKRATGDQYLAGLWRRNLVSGLSWHQDGTQKGSNAILWNQARASPSWSWVKVDGPVSFSHAENCTATVEDAHIVCNEIKGQYPDARLEVGGFIVLKARVSTLTAAQLMPKFKFVSLDWTSSPSGFANYIYLDGGWSNPQFDRSPGVGGRPRVTGPEALRLMELSWGYQGGRQNVAAESRGLVIIPVLGERYTYWRTGFFVVALEYDAEWGDLQGRELVSCLTSESGTVRPTQFGEIWKASLVEETIILI